ncbi:hypothetical protein ACOMHN_060743 [Nucella lapillus]
MEQLTAAQDAYEKQRLAQLDFINERLKQQGHAVYTFKNVDIAIKEYYLVTAICCETKCFKADTLGEKEGNVYYCSNDQKPDCCQRNSDFTCCESSDAKTWKEQAQLWGTVAAVAILIGVAFVCCRQDLSFCNGDEGTLSQRFGLKLTDLGQAGRRQKEATTTNKPKNGNSRSVSGRGGGLPPLPPLARQDNDHHQQYHGSSQRGQYNAGYNQFEEDHYRY